MKQLYGFIIFAVSLLLSCTAYAAEYGYKRIYYTGQTSIACNGDTIRLPKFEYSQERITRRGPFLVVDEANCTPDSFLIKIESAARCTGKPQCLLAQFAKFPTADAPELSEILSNRLTDNAMQVDIVQGLHSAYFLPMSRGVLPRLIWWNQNHKTVYILSSEGGNSSATVNSLAATAQAYIEAEATP